jgi:hypothetical protein
MFQQSLLLHSLNLGLLTLLFFIIGMIKPKWALFFMEKPTRWLVAIITTVCFMIVMTMYGEGNKAKIVAKHTKPAAASVAPDPVSVPESVPVPIPAEAIKEAPKKK